MIFTTYWQFCPEFPASQNWSQSKEHPQLRLFSVICQYENKSLNHNIQRLNLQ